MELSALLYEMQKIEESMAKHGGMPLSTALRAAEAAANEQDHRAETDAAVRRYIQSEDAKLTGLTPWTFHFLVHRLHYAILVLGGMLSLPPDRLVYRNGEREELLEEFLIALWKKAGASYYQWRMETTPQLGKTDSE